MSVKANVRSPYFLKFSDNTLTSVELSLYVYSGDVTTDKGSVVYTLSNDVIEGNNYVIFQVADFVRDYIEHSFTGSYSTTPYWLTAEATLYSGDTALRTEVIDRLAFDGYTKYEDGINYEGERSELITTRTIRVPEGQVYRLPIFSEDVVSITEQTLLSSELVTAGAFWNEENQEWQVHESYWDNSAQDNISVVSTDVDSSVTKVQYFPIASTVDRVTVSTSGNSYEIIGSEEECSKYGWDKLTFINKHGVLQDFYTTGKKEENVTYKDSDYKSSDINFSTMSYDVSHGQTRRFDINSKKKLTLNSGFMHENEMSALEELIMSEHVWLTTEEGVVSKVIPTDRRLKISNHLNDKLINVKINLELASDNINTVI